MVGRSLVALVTGAGSGLGLATAKRLARLGARVVAMDLKPDQQLAGSELIVNVRGDIRSEEDINKALDCCRTNDRQAQLDVLVNCAGVGSAYKLFNFDKKQPHTLEDFQDLIDINVVGTFNVIRLAIGLMIGNGARSSGSRGLIINTSSILAFDGHENQVAFAATQGAINSMTVPLARDLAAANIRCNTIAVGFFNTPLITCCGEGFVLLKEYIEAVTPCPSRLGDPEEFAHLVQKIINNQMINGEIIRLDAACRWPERGL